MSAAASRAPLVTPVLIAGCIVIVISFAIRASFGVFQIPIEDEFGWLRTDFSMAIAITPASTGITGSSRGIHTRFGWSKIFY